MHKGAQGGYRNNRNTRSVDKKTEKFSRSTAETARARAAGEPGGREQRPPLGATPPLEEGEGWCGRKAQDLVVKQKERGRSAGRQDRSEGDRTAQNSVEQNPRESAMTVCHKQGEFGQCKRLVQAEETALSRG